jgi:glutathione peroxidase
MSLSARRCDTGTLGTNNEIGEFRRLTCGIEFPIFEKSSVTRITDPLWADLRSPVNRRGENFRKYLVDRDGHRVTGFGSVPSPRIAS